MLRASVCLGLILGTAASAQCSVDSDGKSTCPDTDQNALLQSRVHLSLEQEEKKEYEYGPRKMQTPLLTYFKHWAKGSVESRLPKIVSIDQDGSTAPSKPSLMETDTAALSAAAASDALAVTMINQCPDQSDSDPVTGPRGHIHTPAMAAIMRAGYQVVHAEPADSNGVRHTLLKDRLGKLQYMASYAPHDGVHHAVRTDPNICSKSGPLSFAEELDSGDEDDDPEIKSSDPIMPDNSNGINANDPIPKPNSGAGEPNSLTTDDPLALDCKALFEATFAENCGAAVAVEIVAAEREILDGVAVKMEVRVCKAEMCHYHVPTCVWEQDTDHTDAKLLEISDDAHAAADPHDTSIAGLQATLKLRTDLCQAAEAGTVADAEANDMLKNTVSLGELSRYVGYEHVWDEIPVYSALEVETPGDVDFRTNYPTCYPTLPNKAPGTEVVRNQGTCGSCWAFASATATMGNLCHSDSANKHSMFSSSDRFEVSTQKIMSCKPKGKSTALGCQGGHMQQFNDEAKTWGLTKERDNPYACGGGNPKNHFSQQAANCDKFPWGGTCSGNAMQSWWWGGANRISGETGMKTFIAKGQGMYVSMDCYGNFMSHKSGVYSSASGGKKGGHAMTAMGYGVDGGKKYWLIQNSWGPNWGEGGRVKFGRGTNLVGIEDNAAVPRVWVSGGAQPDCQDSTTGSGLTYSSGQALACGSAAAYCNHGSFGGTVSANCPKTCGTCGGFNGKGTSPAPGPSPKPNPKPAPSPSQPPSPPPSSSKGCCSDKCKTSSDCWKGGWGANDKLFCCPGHGMCMGRDTYGNYGNNCKECSKNNAPPAPPSPPPPPPSPNKPPSPPPSPAAGTGCCRDACSSSKDCGNNLFCCPGHKMCMDRTTKSTRGTNCDICKGHPPPPPPPPPAPAPPAPAGAATCSFEAPQKPYCGIWNDAQNDNFDWTRQQKRTPSGGTGPDKAADGTYYLFTEASRPRKTGDKATLSSASTKIVGTDAKLQFQYHMYSKGGMSHLGDLIVTVAKNGDLPDQVWDAAKAGAKSSKDWQAGSVDLASFSGDEVIISFTMTRKGSWRSDIAIDNVALYAGKAAPPPPPPPPPPTTAPTGPPTQPATTAAPSGGDPVPQNCVDSLHFEDGNGEGCQDWAKKTCTETEVKRHCPRACKICSSDVSDDAAYTDPTYKLGCAEWAGHSCRGYEFTPDLVLSCPKACGAA